jgi:hypothetical protein
MSAMQTTLAIGAVVLSSGVVAAIVSGVMTERWERRRALLDRRLNAAADFIGAAARASNALDALVQEIHEPIPTDARSHELLEQAAAVSVAIDGAVERAGLVRVLYGPAHPDISGNANQWAARARRSVDGARGWLWIALGTARDAGVMNEQKHKCLSEFGAAKEAIHNFEIAAAAAWDSHSWWRRTLARPRPE